MNKETEEKIVGWFCAMADFLPKDTVKDELKLTKNFQDNLGIDLNETGGDNAFLFAALAVYFLENEGVISNLDKYIYPKDSDIVNCSNCHKEYKVGDILNFFRDINKETNKNK